MLRENRRGSLLLLHFDRVRLGYGSALGFGSEKV